MISYPNLLAWEWKQIPKIAWVPHVEAETLLYHLNSVYVEGSPHMWESTTFPILAGWKPEVVLAQSHVLPPLHQLPSPTDFPLATNQMYLLQPLPPTILLHKLPSALAGTFQHPPLGSGCISSPWHLHIAPTGLLWIGEQSSNCGADTFRDFPQLSE